MLAETKTIPASRSTAFAGELRVEQARGVFFCLAAVLLGFGVLMVHSASITSWPTEFERVYLSRHVIFLALGVVAAAVCSHCRAQFWYRAAPVLFAASVVLLVLVLVPGVGTRVNGAQRWLRYGPMSLQPSEFAKIALPLFVCRQICRHRESFSRWLGGLIPVALPAAIVLPLVILQPNFGTTAFLAAGCGIAMIVGGWPLRYFVLSASLLIPAAVFQFPLRPYQMRRITGFLATWTDLSLAPYQLKQSLVTLGAGGLFGVGIGKGWQKLSFLPEANTDFVFAVVGEELGMIGTLSLVLVWAALYFTGLRLLQTVERDSFAYAAGFTLLTQLALQALMNMAVVTALVPPTGIPHPFLSYGGSNLLASMIALGIIVGLTRTDHEGIEGSESEG